MVQARCAGNSPTRRRSLPGSFGTRWPAPAVATAMRKFSSKTCPSYAARRAAISQIRQGIGCKIQCGFGRLLDTSKAAKKLSSARARLTLRGLVVLLGALCPLLGVVIPGSTTVTIFLSARLNRFFVASQFSGKSRWMEIHHRFFTACSREAAVSIFAAHAAQSNPADGILGASIPPQLRSKMSGTLVKNALT